MHAVRSRRRVAVVSAIIVALAALGWLTFPHLLRAQRASTLIAAVYSGDQQKVQWLLDNGFDPNSANLIGLKPLMRAVTVPPQLVSPEVVQLLLWYGADPNIRNSRGETVLDIALENKLPDKVVGVLKSNRAKRASELP